MLKSYKLEKSIIYNTDMIDFKKDMDHAQNKLKSEYGVDRSFLTALLNVKNSSVAKMQMV